MIIGLALLGFPVTLILAWVYDLTPGGVVRTKPVEEEARDVRRGLAHLVERHAGVVRPLPPEQDPRQLESRLASLAVCLAAVAFAGIAAAQPELQHTGSLTSPPPVGWGPWDARTLAVTDVDARLVDWSISPCRWANPGTRHPKSPWPPCGKTWTC